MSYCSLTNEEIPTHKPTIIFVDENNKIKEKTDKVVAGKIIQ
jgi:aspartate 1-decarboxylase